MLARERSRLLVTPFLVAFAGTILTVRLTAIAAALAVQQQGTWQNPGPWVDWRTYANAFERLLHGDGIYSPHQLHGAYQLTHVVLVGYAYPPVSVPLFAPFASYPFGLAAWLTVNLGLLLTALWALLSRASPRHRGVFFAIALTALTLYGPFVIGVVSANISVGLSGLVGWVALGVSPRVASLFGAAGAVTKIFSSVLVLGTAQEKRRSILMGAGLVLAASALTLPLVGIQSWIDFARAMAFNVPDCYVGNLSIACALAPGVGLPIAVTTGILVGIAAAVLALLVRDRFLLALLAAVAMVAPVSNLHAHYWIVLPVLGVAALERVRALREDRSPSPRAYLDSPSRETGDQIDPTPVLSSRP